MTNFRQYFKKHLKDNIRTLIYVHTVVLVLTFILGMNLQPVYKYGDSPRLVAYNATLYIPVIFLGILAYVLPVTEFSFFKKRINLDCAYSLPISRKAMGTVHYLVGLIVLIGAFSSSYLLNFILLLTRGPGWFDFSPMILHYLFCVLLGICIYSFLVFVFNEANTKNDGIWFMILYTFVFLFILTALDEIKIIEIDWNMNQPYDFIPFAPLARVTDNYTYLVELRQKNYPYYSSSEPKGLSGALIFWVILGIASAAGFFLTFGERRMERTEEISDSWFGFRTLIPVYAICGNLTFYSLIDDSIFLWVVIELMALLGYTIYRRGFHYKLSDIVILSLLLIFLVV